MGNGFKGGRVQVSMTNVESIGAGGLIDRAT